MTGLEVNVDSAGTAQVLPQSIPVWIVTAI